MQNLQEFNPVLTGQHDLPGLGNDPASEISEFAKDDIEQSIPSRFEQQVGLYPHHLAIKSKTKTLTYDELNKAANRIARVVLAKCGEGQEPVALLFGHDIPVIVAIMAVLKAGKIYSVMDPSFPQARHHKMLEDLQSQLIITNNKHLSIAKEIAQDKYQLINIDEIGDSFSSENLGLSIPPSALAAIFYTSGSTGQPKGVLRSHLGVLHTTWLNVQYHRTRPDDRLSHLFSCGFGASGTHLYNSLLNGATLLPFNIKQEGFDQFLNWLIQEEITILHSPVAFFRQFIDTLTSPGNFPKVRLIALGGAVLYKKDVERIREYFSPDCIVESRLTTTETSTISRLLIDHQTEITSNVVPVGYQMEDKEILILDDTGQNLGFNQVGEFAIRSRYMAPGYWQKPELTQAKFLPDPAGGDKRIYLTGDLGRMSPDGSLERLGRKDFQIKIRGYRVDVAEVEGALYSLDIIKGAVVVAQDKRQSVEKYLVAYVVPASQPAPTVSTVRSDLAEIMPEYMIPSIFIMLEKLPLTPNGKVDRTALPEPSSARPALSEAYVAPQTPTEERLAAIWSEVLHIESIGINDNFFELGGQSLLAAQVNSRILNTFQVSLSLQALFESPTIAGLAALIAQSQTDVVGDEELGHLLDELEQLSEEEVQRLLAQEKE